MDKNIIPLKNGNRFLDLTNKRFGKLFVKEYYGYKEVTSKTSNKRKSYWICNCDCGKEIICKGENLRSGDTKSCGCLKKDKNSPYKKKRELLIERGSITEDLIGKKFNKLTVLSFYGYVDTNTKYGRVAKWYCKCECGKEKIVDSHSLKKGNTKSCGCLYKMRENPIRIARGPVLPFGESNFRKTYKAYIRNSIKRNIEWNLTEEQVRELFKAECFYCGDVNSNNANSSDTNGEFKYNGIDRIDNEKGYYIENVVPCCKFCNIAKRDFTQQEFYEKIIKISNNQPWNK